MTITPLTIYLIGSADNVCAFLVICCVLCCIAFGLSVFIIEILQDDMPRSESDPATWDYCERTAMTYVPAAKKTIKLSIPLFNIPGHKCLFPSHDTITVSIFIKSRILKVLIRINNTGPNTGPNTNPYKYKAAWEY